MASLANQTISSTYDGLIKTSTDQPVPISGVQLLEDGVGNSLALSVGRANQGVTVTGTLTATSITGVLADGVTATTQTLGDNSTKVATTAYVDAQVTASDLDFAGDSGTGAVDLDSQTFTIAGTANEIETSVSGQTVTIGLPSSVTVGTLSATTLGGTLSTAAQPNITSVDGDLTLGSGEVVGTLNLTGSTYKIDGGNSFGDIRISAPRLRYFHDGSTINLNIDNGLHQFFNSSGTESMRIDSSGNVGIGTSSPAEKLDVNGNIKIAADSYIDIGTTPSDVLYIGKPSGSTGGIQRQLQIRGRYSSGDRTLTLTTGASLDSTISASDNLAFDTAGSERLRITSAGNVGIGTSSPSSPLTVVGGAIRSKDTDGEVGFDFYQTSSGGLIRMRDNKPVAIYTNNAERMRIDSSGNVGIGTTSPASMLNVVGTNTSQQGLFVTTTGTGNNFYAIKVATGTSADTFSVTNAGRVGIGTSSPSAFIGNGTALHLYNATTSPEIRVQRGNGSDLSIVSTSTAGGSVIRTTTASPLILGSNNVERMRITSGGNVEIAAGGLTAGTITVGRNSNFSSLGAVSDGNGTTTAFLNGYSTASGTSNAIIYTNGTYGSRTNTYGAILSDERYKENIVDTSPKLDKIMQVKVRNFNLIGDDLKQIGVIAQEVEQVFPSLVYERELTENVETVDEEGNVTSEIKPTGETAKAVKDSIFTYILLKAVQEQQEIINDLKARIETLETK